MSDKIKFSQIRPFISEIRYRCRHENPVWFIDKKMAKKIVDSLHPSPKSFNWDTLYSGTTIGTFEGVEIKIYEI